MGRRVPITSAKEEEILAALQVTSHASRVAAAVGVSFSTVWRRAEQNGIALTDGRKAKGYKRLSSQKREKIMEIRRAKPAATQLEVAHEAGVSRATVSRVTRGHRRRVKNSPVV
jgi:DNA-binding LacI/PurR family transcriptional regulator